MKRLLFILFLFSFINCFGFEPVIQDPPKKILLESPDSSIKFINGKKYITYNVKSGDSWYGIARKFNISYSELRLSNNESDDHLSPGKEILIPYNKLKSNDSFYSKKKIVTPQTPKPKTTSAKFHTVTKSQTLFSISKMYGVTVAELKEWNKLSSNTISIGQKLLVEKDADNAGTKNKNEIVVPSKEKNTSEKNGEIKTPEASPTTISKEKNETLNTKKPEKTDENKNENPEGNVTSGNDDSEEKIIFSKNRFKKNESGLAVVLEDENSDNEKYYALHRTAPIGTVIQVLNLTNSKKVYVKVTGQLTDLSENEGVVIKISKASAEKLGVIENKFQVNIMYGLDKE
jgi:LysM repeat protein